MKRRHWAVCVLLSLLFLAGCAGAEDPAPVKSPSPSPAEISVPVKTQQASPNIVLQGVDAPGMNLDVAGFEYSLWGDSMEDVLAGEDLSNWTLVNNDATFGGIPCQAYYSFHGERLAAGYYSMNFGADGTEGFQAVLAYLTELYGEPNFLYDGQGEAVTDPDTGFADGLGQVSWGGTSSERLKANTIVTIWGLENGVVNVAFVESGYRENQE